MLRNDHFSGGEQWVPQGPTEHGTASTEPKARKACGLFTTIEKVE
jgi:hypothetical protein